MKSVQPAGNSIELAKLCGSGENAFHRRVSTTCKRNYPFIRFEGQGLLYPFKFASGKDVLTNLNGIFDHGYLPSWKCSPKGAWEIKFSNPIYSKDFGKPSNVVVM